MLGCVIPIPFLPIKNWFAQWNPHKVNKFWNFFLKSENFVEMANQERSFVKQAGFQLIAGGAAGCVEVSIMHPLDLVKTRFQIQATPVQGLESQHYNGIGNVQL